MRKIATINLKIGLVNIPLSVNSFLDYQGLSFKQLCPKCEHRIHLKRWCDECNKEVGYSELKSGYQITKNQIVVIPKEWDLDIDTRIISVIKSSVEYDFLTHKCYLLTPLKDIEKPYHLLKNLLMTYDVSLVIEYSFRKKLHLGIIKPIMIKGRMFLLLKQILYAESVKPITPIIDIQISEEELELGKKLFEIIKNELKDVNYLQVKDRRRELLEKALKGEIKTVKVEVKKKEGLVEQLKSSVKLTQIKKKKKVKV